jgi:uncharacterized protein YggE
VKHFPAGFVILALISAPCASLPAQAVPTPPAPPEIATSADGEATLPPSKALIRLDVETRASKAGEASNQAGRRVRAVREAIHALGFPLDSIRTVSFTVSPTYDYQKGQKPIDYRAVGSIELTVRKLEQIGPVLDTALASGVTQVPDITFDSDSLPVARNLAITRALNRARADAEAIARAAGGRLGRLLSATTSGSPMPYPVMRAKMTLQEQGGAPDVSQEVTVRVSVQARWEFLEQR